MRAYQSEDLKKLLKNPEEAEKLRKTVASIAKLGKEPNGESNISFERKIKQDSDKK